MKKISPYKKISHENPVEVKRITFIIPNGMRYLCTIQTSYTLFSIFLCNSLFCMKSQSTWWMYAWVYNNIRPSLDCKGRKITCPKNRASMIIRYVRINRLSVLFNRAAIILHYWYSYRNVVGVCISRVIVNFISILPFARGRNPVLRFHTTFIQSNIPLKILVRIKFKSSIN